MCRQGPRPTWVQALRFAALVWRGWARIVASGCDPDVEQREIARMKAAEAALYKAAEQKEKGGHAGSWQPGPPQPPRTG